LGIFSGWKIEDEDEARALNLVVRMATNAAALWLAARVVNGIEIEGLRALLATAAIFGVVNALIKPVAHLVGCPLTCLTFGLFALVINAAMLVLAAEIAGWLNLPVSVEWFWPAIWGALIVGIASTALSALVGRPPRRSRDDESASDLD
jgi:putative membrane protein